MKQTQIQKLRAELKRTTSDLVARNQELIQRQKETQELNAKLEAAKAESHKLRDALIASHERVRRLRSDRRNLEGTVHVLVQSSDLHSGRTLVEPLPGADLLIVPAEQPR